MYLLLSRKYNVIQKFKCSTEENISGGKAKPENADWIFRKLISEIPPKEDNKQHYPNVFTLS